MELFNKDLNLEEIAHDSIDRTPAIVAETPGARDESVFIKEGDLQPLTKLPPEQLNPPTQVRIINDDAFTIAREIIKRDPSAQGHVAVLNLASDIYRAGGWIKTLSQTQVSILFPCSDQFSMISFISSLPGRSTVLLFDTLLDAQARILSLGEHRTGFCSRNLFASHSSVQRRPHGRLQ